MFPPVFEIVADSSAVTSLLGTAPVRFYPFGQAPQQPVLPYAVWQTVTGEPENYLNDTPDVDRFGIQIDVYASTGAVARQLAAALRDAVEPQAYVTSWRGEGRDAETLHYSYSFDVSFHVIR